MFSHDEKQITAEELSELIINHMEFHGMDMEFYLLDPQDASKVCNILQEDSKYLPMWVIQFSKIILLNMSIIPPTAWISPIRQLCPYRMIC